MSISVNKLTEKINASSARETISELDLLQLQLAANSISQVYSVASTASLPAATNNKGRMIFVTSESRYYVSDGISWSDDLHSSITSILYTWGRSNNGALGYGTTVDKSSPVQPSGGFSDWIKVSVGSGNVLGIRKNGTLWTWGTNNSGNLGDGTEVNKSSPVSVLGGFTDWCQVSAGFKHTAAVRQNGTLWTWGEAANGKLGDNTTVNKSSPISVVGGFTDWCQVSAGAEFTIALRTNGTIWAWGQNGVGQLGNNRSGQAAEERSSPVSVVGGFTDWCQVSTGFIGTSHALAVRTNGTLWSWGYNNRGQLGDGTVVSKSSPVSVIGGFTDWCQVSAGVFSSAAIRQNGTLWTWGSNSSTGGTPSGNLGDGTSSYKTSPVSVIGGFTDWCQVSMGCYKTSAVRTNGTLWAWGENEFGELGDGTTVAKCSPVSVVGGITKWCQVSFGRQNSAAIALIKNGF